MMESIKANEVLQEGEEVAIEYKSDTTKEIIEALEDNGETLHEELKSEEVTPVVGKKPVFANPYERFVYELKNDCVTEKTKKLAEKFKEAWESAKKDVKKAG